MFELSGGNEGSLPGAVGPLGAALAAVVDTADLDALGDDGLLSVIAGCERLVAWSQARQQAAILAFAARMNDQVTQADHPHRR